MTHAASFDLEEELQKKLKASCGISTSSIDALQMRIVDEKLKATCTLPSGSSDMNGAVRQWLSADPFAPCYVFARLEPEVWLLASFVPDGAAVRQKMLYSAGRESVRKAVGAFARVVEVHWASLDEVDVVEATQSDAAKLALMTKVERMAIDDAKQAAIEAAGEKVSSASLAFPLSSSASARLSAFSSGAASLAVLTIARETIELIDTPTEANASALQPMLPQRAPAYLLYRWAHTPPAGEATATPIFLYCCPEESPVRAKMLHASTKGGVIAHFKEAGIQIAKSFEVSDLADVTESLFFSELYPPEEQQQAFSRPAPRAGRKLTKRRDA
uniref:ADF-H domain-containing protein n=1 Tax=Chrysotila carterae TaxID=13221 RepID=A0A7S4B3L4_CHRCT|mmetsp:Transcript_11468/g.24766  ORF Transcript_11468/g.24766 Transcript_11468/m.24766 type:complete len:330 (+) Transcript_11468:111-1100(+)